MELEARAQRAERERDRGQQRAAQLAAKLLELGIDPDEIAPES